MYLLALVVLLALGGWLGYAGVNRRRPVLAVAGAAVVLATVSVFGSLSLWGEALWFEALGYGQRFWTVLGAETTAAVIAAVGAALAVRALLGGLERARVGWLPEILAGLVGAAFGLEGWQTVLLYLNRVSTSMSEPILGRDTGFYLFVLPFYEGLHALAWWTAVIALAAVGVDAALRVQDGRAASAGAFLAPRPALRCVLALAVVVAAGCVLDAFGLLLTRHGVVFGAGWTDVHVRLPAYLTLAVLILAGAVASALPAVQRRCAARLRGRLPVPAPLAGAVLAAASIAALWVLGLGLLPALAQWLIVQPNEITLEKPYLEQNIRFTRHGFDLHRAEEREFPVAGELDRANLERNRGVLSNVRLWDWRALDEVYGQFQEIRLYYTFTDVDVDRYWIDGAYREVMVSAREMDHSSLPRPSRTFVNERFKYTHGYGLTLTSVSEFTEQGLPNLLVKDIPPRSAFPSLEVTEPRIYYGEQTRDPVVVNTDQQEFDYPRGDRNAYNRYDGRGGVPMGSLWRRFLFGWKFDGTRLLLSSYPNRASRIMFHRQVMERVAEVAPFLKLDPDPYVALVDGRIYWIVDAYTASRSYPYSEAFRGVARSPAAGPPAQGPSRQVDPFAGEPVSYVRNSVKVVVDAYNGSVDLYVFDPDDPLIRAWSRAFPSLFKPARQMPPGLRAHVRYPAGMLLTQGLMYAKYHMDDPEVFYNQEDLWVRATEKYYGAVQPVEPYYVMWELPGSDKPQFVLILPFTPKNRQVMIGWIAGMSDGDDYGRFIAYKFPKERRVIGPQQVETKIDQDRFLSGQLTLWDQRGSHVIRGNMLAIPIDQTLLYVEPIYLQAETAAYPELRLVVVMHGDKMSYAETFDAALRGLFEESGEAGPALEAPGRPSSKLGREANDAFRRYLELQGREDFEGAAAELARLKRLLEQLAGSSGQ